MKSDFARITLRTEITFICEWALTQILIVNSHLLYIESWFTQFNFNSIFQFLYAGQMEDISWKRKYNPFLQLFRIIDNMYLCAHPLQLMMTLRFPEWCEGRTKGGLTWIGSAFGVHEAVLFTETLTKCSKVHKK